MAFNQKFATHIATRNGESVETTYFKYRGGHIKSSEKGRGLESHGQDEETVKNKVESREEDGGAVQSQSRTRVWNCIFRIHDLTKRYGIRKNAKYLDGKRYLTATRIHQSLVTRCRIFCLSVGECKSTKRVFCGFCHQSKL